MTDLVWLSFELEVKFFMALVYNLTFSDLEQSRNPVFNNAGVNANTGAVGGLFAWAGTISAAWRAAPGLMFSAAGLAAILLVETILIY